MIVGFGWTLAASVWLLLGPGPAVAAMLPAFALVGRSLIRDFRTARSRTLFVLGAGPYLFWVVGAGAWGVNYGIARAFSSFARGTVSGIVIGLLWLGAPVFMAVTHHRDLNAEY